MREITPEEVVMFIRETHPLQEWRESDVLPDWVAWMMAHGCVEAFTEDGERLSVLLCARLSSEDKSEELFDIDPEGDCLVIDLLLTRKQNPKPFLAGMASVLEEKYGTPESVRWTRGSRGPRTYKVPSILKRFTNYKDKQ